MRFVIERVSNAKLSVNNTLVSEIGKGFIVFLGVLDGDTMENVHKVARRIATVRLFVDENHKLNYNIQQVGGEILLISNFTLCDKKGAGGARPDFTICAKKDEAQKLYLAVKEELEKTYNIPIKLGRFGENMQIDTHLDGPITLHQEY